VSSFRYRLRGAETVNQDTISITPLFANRPFPPPVLSFRSLNLNPIPTTILSRSLSLTTESPRSRRTSDGELLQITRPERNGLSIISLYSLPRCGARRTKKTPMKRRKMAIEAMIPTLSHVLTRWRVSVVVRLYGMLARSRGRKSLRIEKREISARTRWFWRRLMNRHV
jgi:hypothetical protein